MSDLTFATDGSNTLTGDSSIPDGWSPDGSQDFAAPSVPADVPTDFSQPKPVIDPNQYNPPFNPALLNDPTYQAQQQAALNTEIASNMAPGLAADAAKTAAENVANQKALGLLNAAGGGTPPAPTNWAAIVIGSAAVLGLLFLLARGK